MKKTFKLNGLDCANCAAKIEHALTKINGVEEATVNFMTTKMQITAERDDMDAIIGEATKIIHKLEPDVDIQRA